MNRRAYAVVLAVFLGWTIVETAAHAQSIVLPTASTEQHVCVDLPQGTYDPQAHYDLTASDNSSLRLSAQVIPALKADGTIDSENFQLLVSLPPSDQDKGERTFELATGTLGVPVAPFRFDRSDTSLKLTEVASGAQEARPVWQYNFGTIVDETVPQSDSRRSRSCYIHPVWGMNGEILSDDFPKDHYHHHGIFWTWPHVKVGDQPYDLWMSTNIRQRFIQYLAKQTGPAGAVLGVENGWYVGDKQVATERVWVRTYRSDADSRALDISLFIEAGDSPVTLQGAQAKSYGGLTFRYDVLPRKDATVRVPGMKLGFGAPKRPGGADLLNTPLPWADLTTQIPGAPHRSGAAIFIDPQHPDYPPSWLTRTYGALCVGWPGVESDTIEPGHHVRLDYRIWVHGHEVEVDELERRYRAYCAAR